MSTNGPNNAIIGADATSVITTDSVGIFFKVLIPATDITFKLHFDPDVFELVLGSLECSFIQHYMNTDIPGTIEFRGSCKQDRSKATTTVRFAFKPKRITESSSFSLTDVFTNPISTLTVPSITINVSPAQISYIITPEMKDDTDNSNN